MIISLDWDISCGITSYGKPCEFDSPDELINVPDEIIAKWDMVIREWEIVQQEMFEWYEKVRPAKEYRMLMELEHFEKTGELV